MDFHYMTTIGKHKLRDMTIVTIIFIVTRYDNDPKNPVITLWDINALRQKPSQKRKNQKLFFKWEEIKFSQKNLNGEINHDFSDQVIIQGKWQSSFKLDFLKEKLIRTKST
jgi:hypothetical protein